MMTVAPGLSRGAGFGPHELTRDHPEDADHDAGDHSDK